MIFRTMLLRQTLSMNDDDDDDDSYSSVLPSELRFSFLGVFRISKILRDVFDR